MTDDWYSPNAPLPKPYVMVSFKDVRGIGHAHPPFSPVRDRAPVRRLYGQEDMNMTNRTQVEETKSMESRELTSDELNAVAGGSITGVQVNGGGNTPNGQANGVPTIYENPAGHIPPGQNA
jgi:hypothetical protein